MARVQLARPSAPRPCPSPLAMMRPTLASPGEPETRRKSVNQVGTSQTRCLSGSCCHSLSSILTSLLHLFHILCTYFSHSVLLLGFLSLTFCFLFFCLFLVSPLHPSLFVTLLCCLCLFLSSVIFSALICSFSAGLSVHLSWVGPCTSHRDLHSLPLPPAAPSLINMCLVHGSRTVLREGFSWALN